MSEPRNTATESAAPNIEYREGTLETRGVKLFYKTTGDGPPLLILHGGPGSSHDYLWEPLLPLASIRTLIFLDQRGCGRSGKNPPGVPYTWEAMVEDVEFLRHGLRLGKLDILGHSFGGILAQSYAVAYPANVRSLLLVATASSMRSVNADLKRVKESAAPETRKRLEALETLGIYGPDGAQRPEYRRLADEALMPYIYIDKAPTPSFPTHDYAWDVMRDIWGSDSEFEASGDARDIDLVPRLRTLSIPAIVIYGDHDIVSDATARETRAALKGSTLVRVAGAAHEVYEDQPEKFLEAAQSFLSQSFLDARPRPQDKPESMDIINAEIYDLQDVAARARHVDAARRQLEKTGSAAIPDFVSAAALAAMIEEAKTQFTHAHRREMELGFNPKDELLLGDPVLLGRKSPFRMDSLGSDLLDEDKPLKRLYRSREMIEFIREIVGVQSLHCTADPLINATITYMGDGDQQGWHFDDNDFVVSLLLQSPESGGNFEYVPNATTLALPEIDAIMNGESTLTQRLVPRPGTLLLFRGRKALHRVAPVSGSRLRIIVLLSYDRSPDFVYADQVRQNALGRTTQIRP